MEPQEEKAPESTPHLLILWMPVRPIVGIAGFILETL